MQIKGNKEPAMTEANNAYTSISAMHPEMEIYASTNTMISQINSSLANNTFSINVSANVTGLPSGGPASTSRAMGTLSGAFATGTLKPTHAVNMTEAFSRGTDAGIHGD